MGGFWGKFTTQVAFDLGPPGGWIDVEIWKEGAGRRAEPG